VTHNEVFAASSFMDADTLIAAKCQRDWPGDARMLSYCWDKQHAAVATLKSHMPFGPDEELARVKCSEEWPDDYSMRLYCEQKGAR
jgi:hypothetical protein